jgi:hypothetical protein
MSPAQRPSTIAGLRRAVTPAPATTEAVPPVTGAPQRPRPRPRPRPEKPVRFTLDLDRNRHKFLKNYATEIEARGASEIMRAMLDELRDDPELAARVRARVWQHETNS